MRIMAVVRQTFVEKHFGFGGGPIKFDYHSESRVLKANMSGKKLIQDAADAYPKPYQAGIKLALEKAATNGELAHPTEESVLAILKRADRFDILPADTHDRAVAIVCGSIKPKRARYDSDDEEAEVYQQPHRKPLKKAISLLIEYKSGHDHQRAYCVGSTSQLTGGKFVMEAVTIPEVSTDDPIATLLSKLVGKGTEIQTDPEVGQVVVGGRMVLQFDKPLVVNKGATVGSVSPKCTIMVTRGDGAIEAKAWVAIWCV